eukprot:gene15163-biopygen3210
MAAPDSAPPKTNARARARDPAGRRADRTIFQPSAYPMPQCSCANDGQPDSLQCRHRPTHGPAPKDAQLPTSQPNNAPKSPCPSLRRPAAPVSSEHSDPEFPGTSFPKLHDPLASRDEVPRSGTDVRQRCCLERTFPTTPFPPVRQQLIPVIPVAPSLIPRAHGPRLT